MSIYNDKTLKGVADAVQQVMDEELKGNQHKIDANKNGKIDSHDFKLLRAKKPAVVSTKKPIGVRTADIGPGNKEYNVKVKEEVEEIDEAFPTVADAHRRMGNYTKGTVTKTATGLKHERNYKDEDETEEKTGKKGKTYGANQKRRTNTKLYKESFTSMLKKLDERGIKALDEVFAHEIEEIENSIIKEDVDMEVIDVNEVNGVQVETIEERTLTASETAKKEEIVKSMKKGLSGFKERYGKDAKSVMYATATKQAKKD